MFKFHKRDQYCLAGITGMIMLVYLWWYQENSPVFVINEPYASLEILVLNSEQEPYRYMVDLNKSGVAEFILLPGIGEKLANTILEDRASRQGYQKVEDLLQVKGIGPKSFIPLQDFLYVEPKSDSPATIVKQTGHL